jgi:hypothetical protein
MFTNIDPLSAGTLVDASFESLKEASRECLREKGLEEPCDSTCCLMLLQWDELGKLSCQNIRVFESSCYNPIITYIMLRTLFIGIYVSCNRGPRFKEN